MTTGASSAGSGAVMAFDLKTYRAVVEGFSKGQRYRLGLALVRGEWQRDAWTGVEVELVELCGTADSPFWWCNQWRDGDAPSMQVSVSEERLRAAAFLGKDDGNGCAGDERNGGDPDGGHGGGARGD